MEEEKKYLMDGVTSVEHEEWLAHPATRLLLGQLKSDISDCKEIICDTCKGRTVPDGLELAALGAQLASREALLGYMTEHSL